MIRVQPMSSKQQRSVSLLQIQEATDDVSPALSSVAEESVRPSVTSGSVTPAGNYVVSISINGSDLWNCRKAEHSNSCFQTRDMASVRIRINAHDDDDDEDDDQEDDEGQLSPVQHNKPPSSISSGRTESSDSYASNNSLTSDLGDDEDTDEDSNVIVAAAPPPLPPKTKRKSVSFAAQTTPNDAVIDDCPMTFYLNECSNQHISSDDVKKVDNVVDDVDVGFAGVRDVSLECGTRTIVGNSGTIRGVKNRVRAGIATFLQQSSIVKSYVDREHGKVVVYMTTMGVIRETYLKCQKVRQILRTLMVKFEERDAYMSKDTQLELRERMSCSTASLPQVFLEGRLLGDAETIERLNEAGELRKMLRPYQSANANVTCIKCGDFYLFPCRVCNGSKKSVHRNNFTAEFVALKCMQCDEVGLVRCDLCNPET